MWPSLSILRRPRGDFTTSDELEELKERLEAALGRAVDLVTEPARKVRFQQEIDRDRVRAF